MTNQDFDKRVAKEIFGWVNLRNDLPWPLGNENTHEVLTGTPPDKQPGINEHVPHFSSDIEADYSVFAHVRKNWSGVQITSFWLRLGDVLRTSQNANAVKHGYKPCFEYDPYTGNSLDMMDWYNIGDYSRAALMVP